MRGEVDVEVFVTPGLGDCSYLLASGSEAVLVDPQRDVGSMLEAAETRGLRLRYVLETHVHNDYLSGAAEVRAATGAQTVGPVGARYAFPFMPMADGDEIALGELRLVGLATPGHTPEHTSYAVLAEEGCGAIAVFSGGSLMVGSAGRSDLLGPDLTQELARAQYRSLRRFDSFADDTLLLPTHGAGSFCASGPANEEPTSTIGRERTTNPALTAPDEETFVREHLSGLLAHPTYYAHMAPINRAGPAVRGGVPMPEPLDVEAVARRLERGARLVDARAGAAFASAHVPGSLNSPLEDTFASYVGWLVPFGTQIVLLADGADARAEATVQLFRIGYEPLAGYLDGGVDTWADSGRRLSAYPTATVDDLRAITEREAGRILDVRQRREWDEGHVEGSRHCFVGDLPTRLRELSGAGELVVACVSGHRSSIAASVLDAAGLPVRLVAEGGMPDLLPALA